MTRRAPRPSASGRLVPALSRLLGGFLAALPGLGTAGCGTDAAPPNLVVVNVDTLRADHTSLHGYERDTTPALAEWAEGGTVFERAYAASSWTLPSVSMLLTGQVQVKNEGRIFESQSSLAEILRERGYRTGAFVANRLLDRERGFDSGFDVYGHPRGGQKWLEWAAPSLTERALDFLATDREPFFLYVHYFDPHHPYVPLEGPAFEPFTDPARRRAFREAVRPEHAELFDEGVWRGIEERIARYDTEIRQVDRSLARLFERLAESGLDERTLVVVTADHGEGLWQRPISEGEKPKEAAFFPWLYFEHGVQLYEEQVRVPLVFRGPGVPAGERVAEPVSQLDVVPTILSLLDLPRTEMLAGSALLPEPSGRDRPVFTICSRGRTVTVDGRWRLHRPADYRVEKGVESELYDLESDPLELAELDAPEREAELRELVDGWYRAHAEIDWGNFRPLDVEREREKFSKVGYVYDELVGEDAEASAGAGKEDGDGGAGSGSPDAPADPSAPPDG